MKPIIQLALLIFLFASCGQEGKKVNDSNLAFITSDLKINSPSTKESDKGVSTKYFPITDNQMKVIREYPFPSNWSLGDSNDSEVFVQNNNGAKVFKSLPFSFIVYESNAQNNYLKELGYDSTPVEDVNSVLEKRIMAITDSSKIRLVKKYEHPEIAKAQMAYDSLFISFSKPKKKYETVVTEWDNDMGCRGVVVIGYYELSYDKETYWGYSLSSMEAADDDYQDAKDDFLRSLINFRPCYKNIFDQNKIEIYKITRNNTAQYFPPDQERKRREMVASEQRRTGTYEWDNYKEYLKNLSKKGVLVDTDSLSKCSIPQIPIKTTNYWSRATEYIITDDNQDYNNWKEIEKI